MISKAISVDILKYLREDQKLSVEAIATSMDTDVSHINQIIDHKALFSAEDINAYLNSSGLRFWEFAIKAINLEHLPKKGRDRILLCKQLSDHIKKKNF